MYDITYSNNWDGFSTYTEGNGINPGIIKIFDLSYTLWKSGVMYPMIINGTYMVNWNMWTPDYGFTDNNKRYNIDNILTAEVPFNGLI